VRRKRKRRDTRAALNAVGRILGPLHGSSAAGIIYSLAKWCRWCWWAEVGAESR